MSTQPSRIPQANTSKEGQFRQSGSLEVFGVKPRSSNRFKSDRSHGQALCSKETILSHMVRPSVNNDR